MKKSIGSVFLAFVILTFVLSGCIVASTPKLSPEELDKQINDTYHTIVSIQVNVELMNVVFKKISSQELVGLQTITYTQLIFDEVDKVDKKIPEVASPDILKSYWDDALSVHKQIKDILARLAETNSYDLSEMEPIQKHMAQIAEDVEAAIIKEYSYDPSDLSTYRQGELESINSLFDKP